jgi:hypothetical protein
MGDNKLVIIGVMLLILVIIAMRRQSGYMAPRAFGEVIRQLGAAGPGSPMLTPLITTVVKQLKGEIAYREMNIIVTRLNERMPAASKFVPYASDAELNGVFTRASGSGVSSAVIPRDKAIIYLYAATAQAIAEGIRSKLPATSNTAVNVSDGRIEYFEELRAASNTTAKTMLTVGFELVAVSNQDAAPTGNSLSNIVNPLLPAAFTPYTTNADLFTAVFKPVAGATMAPREEHVMKIMLVGVAHLCWLSEQKWDLDPQWVLTNITGFTEPPAGGPAATVTAPAAPATCNTSSYFSASTSACVPCPAGMISPMGATLSTQCTQV